jgi:hypothetical protein
MITTVLAVRSSSLFRHTAVWACAALTVTAVAAAAPAQATARATGHGLPAPARAAAATPPGREWAAFAYYPPKNQLVLFGGSENALLTFPTTIWRWNGTTWSPGS